MNQKSCRASLSCVTVSFDCDPFESPIIFKLFAPYEGGFSENLISSGQLLIKVDGLRRTIGKMNFHRFFVVMTSFAELTLWLQVAVFTFYRRKMGRLNNATLPFRDTPCEKGGSRCHVGQCLSHFSRHIPPRSGLPLHGQCSPRSCVAQATAFCGFLSAIQGASAWSSCPLSAQSNR